MLPKSSSFSKGPISSRWACMYWLMCKAHWSHWWSLRRSCTVDSNSTVVRGLQRGSPGRRLLGMPLIWRSRSATWEKHRGTVLLHYKILQLWTKLLHLKFQNISWNNQANPFLFTLQFTNKRYLSMYLWLKIYRCICLAIDISTYL